MAASLKDPDLLLVHSEQVKEIVKELSECDNVNGESKSKEKSNLYELFYGSDAEDTDEEDWPQINDETRVKMHLERGPPGV
ncbi:hypothetical protein CTI12_AA610950 [Artemisia annua]|uniref:Uncharacterized protein n=1 Tax=Artemisia annua TaxID=35608 RepID=A0A2U1KCJ7_ARTAN|nr:hypothetical protein CTI12_AA610950 [Artemisia annua]